jgi:hypothetical protein
VLSEKVNLVNASAAATERGLIVEETTRRRERGFPNTVEVAVTDGGRHGGNDNDRELSVEGTFVSDGSPRILSFDGIASKLRSKARCYSRAIATCPASSARSEPRWEILA